MSFELRNEEGGRFDFSNRGWGYYLNLAERYGWQAAGTLPPEDIPDPKDWQKGYCSNDGQWVSNEDANALAAALVAALNDPLRVEKLTTAARAESETLTKATGRPCHIRVETNDAEYIKQMIDFFQKGRFQIW